MKKRIILTALVALVCTITFGATLKRTILSHNGTLTQYDASEWQQALADAVAGDTVFFTPGTFYGDIKIEKAITLIGSGVSETDAFYHDTSISEVYAGCAKTGESTILEGHVEIAIPNNVTLTKPLMEGLRLPAKNVTVTMPVTGLSIKRCQTTTGWNNEGFFSATATVTNLTLENCYFHSVSCGNLVNPTIRNCYMERLYNMPKETTIRNCTIIEIHGSVNCYFVNCCVYSQRDESSYNTYTNCLYKEYDANSEYPNSTYVSEPAQLTVAQMKENNYYGNDGTVIGPLGGTAPFTLIPGQPYVTANNVTYDSNTKKLNVSLTIKKGK